jgi:putative methylase
MVRRRDLEILLGKVKPHPKPDVYLEQYQTTPRLASTLLHMAAYTFNDLAGKVVCDLGCGTGILALGAAMLDAKYVVGLDLDPEAVRIARENAAICGVENVDWVAGPLEVLGGSFDVVLENPPFGVWRKGADLEFLRKALTLAPIVYSVHKAGNRRYISAAIRRYKGRVTATFKSQMIIPHMFSFHRKPKREVEVEIYRVEKVEQRIEG